MKSESSYECQLTGEMQGGYSTWQLNTEECSNSGKTVQEQSGVTCRQRKEEKDGTHETLMEKKCMAPEITESAAELSQTSFL